MQALRSGLNSIPVALSSYRYPSLHREFPWREFLAECDFALPQVYWIGAHNPDAQLKRCLDEYQELTRLPVIPTGAAFTQGDWSPTTADINKFLNAARDFGLSGANFWEWYPARNLPEVWEAIAEYDWDGSLSPPPPPSAGVRTRVWASALNVRSGPGSNFPVVTTIKQGEQVTVYSLDHAWAKISPDREWWVYSYYLEPVAS